MKTLVQGFVYPNLDKNYLRADTFFLKDLIAECRVDTSPFEVLKSAIWDFKISDYNHSAPWIITVGENKEYISISELSERDKLPTKTLQEFLISPDFAKLKRKQRLTREKTEELAAQLCGNLMPDNYYGMGLPPNASLIYPPIFSALGYDISSEIITKMILVQNNILHQKQEEDKIRQGQSWRELRKQSI